MIGVLMWTPPAGADTFSNVTPITIPATGTGEGTGAAAAPYPSAITVTGIAGNEVITNLTVTLHDFSHVFPDDVDVLLEGPNGVRVLLMSDTGASFGVTDIDLTFDDAGGPLPDATTITSGTYRPTNYGTPDGFPPPVPAAAHGTTLAVYVDLQPNGDWRLFVVDDAEFDVGAIAGGWTLNFTTVATMCGNGAVETGEDCDDSNFVAGDGCGPTCLFEVCGNGFVDPIETCDDGNTISGDGCNNLCIIEFCGDGVVQAGIGESCEDGNNIGGDGCSALCGTEICGNSIVDPGEECDDGNTIGCDGCHTCEFTGPPFCNQTPIAIPAPPGLSQPAAGSPYPSVITPIGIPDGHVVSGLTVTILGYSHVNPDDVDLLLVGPDESTVFLMSDAGGSSDAVDVDVTFADGSPQVPDNTTITTGTYAPTNHSSPDQQFPAPAPIEPFGSTFSAFIGSDPNGDWKLYVVDDASIFETGTIAEGWTLNLTTAFAECGNNTVEPGEQCDDGNTTAADGCSAICNFEICGNGTVDPGEVCDDANLVACDGCAECEIETAPVCGNGVPECGENCDDANVNETDGCLADCTQGPAVPPSPPGCPAVTINSFSSTDTPLPISPFATPTITSTITVAGADRYIHDVNVKTAITHTNCGDLDIAVCSPSGTIVTLTTDNANGFRDVFNGTAWDSQADARLGAPQVPGVTQLVTDALFANGVIKDFVTPEESLAAFDGEDPNGDWTLTVSDDTFDPNGGDLLGWTLSIATLSQVPTSVVLPTVASAPGLAIGPGIGVVTDTITITGGTGTIDNVKVFTDITHTQNADLDITVTSPGGTIVTLTTDNGANNDDVYAGTSLFDVSDPGNPVPYSTPNPASNLVTDTAYTNLVVKTTLVPEEPLAAFKGENPNGAWKITISDDANPNGGTLNSWSLTITTASCDAPQLCDLLLGNDNPDDFCHSHQRFQCIGGSDTELCLPKKVLRNAQNDDILASKCDCYLEDGPCGPVYIVDSFTSIYCLGSCPLGVACTVFEDGRSLNQSILGVDMMSFTRSYRCGCVSGDVDGDGDADLGDLADMFNCFGIHPVPPECEAADFDLDGDVDHDDLDVLRDNLTGPIQP